MNRSRAKIKRQPNPISVASIWSKLTFWWLKPIFLIGMKRRIDESDIYDVPNGMKSEHNTIKLAKEWEVEQREEHPSILRAMFKVHGFEVLSIGILYSIGDSLSRLVQPVCVGGLVSYFAQTTSTNIPKSDAYWFATGIILSTAFSVVMYHPFMMYMYDASSKMRMACGGLIYRKTLRLPRTSTEYGQSGKIINLLSSDLGKFDRALIFLNDTWKGPLESIIVFALVYMEIGAAAIIGMAFLASFIPLQAWIGRKSAALYLKCSERTDFRLKVMNEIIMGIQVIKMYAWENSFAKMIDRIRKKEVDAIRSTAYIDATIDAFAMISKISIFLSLITYIYFGSVITAQKVFIVSSYFNILNMSMVFCWPMALKQISEAHAALERIQEFLLQSETKEPPLKAKSNHSNIKEPSKKDKHSDSEEETEHVWAPSFDIDLELEAGLCAVVGPVGSGKTTLLNVILGEISSDFKSLTINRSISYASQEPWIFEGSVRNNIVFVEDFDEQRYNKVVEVCALERDFKLLPQGDATIVGEQGSSLSGGQKARVNLARAIYKRSDIYLLDDPLSAVDTHVGKHIFEKCIKGFLSDKICVLVTHQLQYLKNEQNVVLLNKGRVEAQGPLHMLERFNKEELIHAQEVQETNRIDNAESKISMRLISTQSNVEDVKENPSIHKDSKSNHYKTYFNAANSSIYVIFVLTLFVVSEIAWTGFDYFLSEWLNWEERVGQSSSIEPDSCSIDSMPMCQRVDQMVSSKRRMYHIFYTGTMLFATLCYLGRSFLFFELCLRISVNLHDMLFRGVSRAKMIFFNKNASGRILDRFTKDVNNIDTVLPSTMTNVFDCLLRFLSIIAINAIVNPLTLIPAAVMCFIFYMIRKVYMNSGSSIKRVEASSRSPLFSHVSATVQGIPTIRAFRAGAILEKEFHAFQDHNTSCWHLYICSSRCFGLYLDVVCLVFIAFTTYSCLFFEDVMEMQSGKVGLVIMSSVSLIGTCQLGIRQSCDLENHMTSVERVVEYAELPPEPSLESDAKNAPRKDWPQYGNIEFKSLSLRYAENASRILRNLTFKINAKEKVGVVGRTGAGKSSIIQSLFRLAQNEGQILIDGVDVGVIGLHDLRKKISIIPQEAVLFSGSLRFNLDPFFERTDDELWHSLEQVEMKSVILTLPGGLESKVLDGGSNFSAGQRQLLCLARAILRNNKILILDEATANVDSETDKLIQETIRRKFADCTVITIAHRLHTVMDSDKVLVVDAGEIVEFDHPYKLILKPDGVFKKLLDQTGTTTANALAAIAKEGYC